MSAAVPAISVLFPFRDAAPFIAEALESIRRQRCGDWELLALDHGSTDGSAAIVRGAADPRVRILDVRGEPTLGAVLNRGWEAAAGRYVARMDADDVASPRRLERQLAFLERTPAVAVCGTWIRVVAAGVMPYTLRYPVGIENARAFTLFASPLSHPTVMMRRSAFEAAGIRYREDLPAAQDTDLWVRCAGVLGMDNLPLPLLRYRVHAGGVTVGRGDVSRRCVCDCLRPALARLLPGVSDDQVAAHARVGNGEGVQSMAQLRLAEVWLGHLLRLNDAAGSYAPAALAAAASMVWFRVCRNSARLGRSVLLSWLRSPLRSAYRPTVAELASFVASAALPRQSRSTA